MHEYTSTPRIWGLTCPGFPEEISRARRWTLDVLADCPRGDDAVLIVSELATNALVHTASKADVFHVSLIRSPHVLMISVMDSGGPDSSPRVEHPEGDATHGRGLGIVALLATRVHVEGDKTSRTITAELALPSAREAAPMPMSRDHNEHQGDETDQAHRYEITAAMNAVIRTCADIVLAHSNRGSWTPAGTPETATPTAALLASARQDVLNKLQLVIRCAETVIHEIEHGPTRSKTPPPW